MVFSKKMYLFNFYAQIRKTGQISEVNLNFPLPTPDITRARLGGKKVADRF